MLRVRPAAVLARRCTSTQVPGLDEFLDEHAFNTPPLQWPAVPKRKDVQTLAREIRTRIVADDTNAALDMLRNVPQPYPRLIVHTTVHALLRSQQAARAGNFLLAFAVERQSTTKLPRIHPTTLAITTKALLALVPKTQGRQDRTRTPRRPSLLLLDAQLVSEPALRTALDLYIQARKLFVPRQNEVTTLIWYALLRQREWVPAALFFEHQVKDYQLLRTLPTLLRTGNPDGQPMTPHSRDHLRRRLAVLRLEDNRPSASLFANLCFRLAGVISSLSKNPDSGLLAPVPVIARQTREPEAPFDASYPDAPPPPPQSPMTLQRASHHGRIVLQALTILGALVDARQLPFGDISAWVSTVGSIPPSFAVFIVYTMIDGRPKRADGRDHLRAVLERYTMSLPRTPHVYSQFPLVTSGLVRRGLRHRMPSTNAGSDPALRTADAPPDGIPGYLGAVEFDGLGARERRKRRIAERTETGRATRGEGAPNSNLRLDSPVTRRPSIQHVTPTDPAEAADDSLMPPPLMPTYEALLKVLLSPGNYLSTPGALFESLPERASKEQRARWNEAAERVEAILDKHELAPFVEEEAAMERHYHAPRSPNNPDPLHLRYPTHPLDFDKYPNPSPVSLPRASGQAQVRLGPAPLTHHRVRMAASVLAHMMYERSPPMPPWESMPIMWLLARRADVLTPLIGRAGPFVAPTDSERKNGEGMESARGLWETVWEGSARARWEAEVSAAEARRIIAEEEHKVGAASIEEEDWAVDGQSGVLRPSEAEEGEDDLEELDTFNRRMVAKTWDRELELYYSGGAQSE
ncbi:hypothetical protein B0H14DRAFT_3012959 [Mycena olivaceomarginata]|nr:hypothetical protein B0H14DRAFT_3012959 [Mycena olivaceomarginata]